jgi:hypothetical protein
MRWKQLACVVGLAGLTGCPHAFGRGGTLERAVAKDVEENLDQMQSECTDEIFKLLCPEGQPPSAQCLDQCGDEFDERG